MTELANSTIGRSCDTTDLGESHMVFKR